MDNVSGYILAFALGYFVASLISVGYLAIEERRERRREEQDNG